MTDQMECEYFSNTESDQSFLFIDFLRYICRSFLTILIDEINKASLQLDRRVNFESENHAILQLLQYSWEEVVDSVVVYTEDDDAVYETNAS